MVIGKMPTTCEPKKRVKTGNTYYEYPCENINRNPHIYKRKDSLHLDDLVFYTHTK